MNSTIKKALIPLFLISIMLSISSCSKKDGDTKEENKNTENQKEEFLQRLKKGNGADILSIAFSKEGKNETKIEEQIKNYNRTSVRVLIEDMKVPNEMKKNTGISDETLDLGFLIKCQTKSNLSYCKLTIDENKTIDNVLKNVASQMQMLLSGLNNISSKDLVVDIFSDTDSKKIYLKSDIVSKLLKEVFNYDLDKFVEIDDVGSNIPGSKKIMNDFDFQLDDKSKVASYIKQNGQDKFLSEYFDISLVEKDIDVYGIKGNKYSIKPDFKKMTKDFSEDFGKENPKESIEHINAIFYYTIDESGNVLAVETNTDIDFSEGMLPKMKETNESLAGSKMHLSMIFEKDSSVKVFLPTETISLDELRSDLEKNPVFSMIFGLNNSLDTLDSLNNTPDSSLNQIENLEEQTEDLEKLVG